MKIKKLIIQFLKFGIIGAMNTLLNLAIVYAIIWIFGEGSLIPANIVAFFITVTIAYLLFIRFVFDASRQNKLLIFFKMLIAYGFTALMSIGLQVLLSHTFKVPVLYVPVLALLLTVPTNFILNKVFVFREKVADYDVK